MTYTIKRITTSTTNKDGKPLIDKNRRPFLKVGLQVAEHGETWVNGLFFGAQIPWKEGEKVDLNITKELYNGKEQLKFEIPRKENPNAKALEELANRMTKVELRMATLENQLKPQPVKYPEGEPPTPNFEPDEDRIPF